MVTPAHCVLQALQSSRCLQHQESTCMTITSLLWNTVTKYCWKTYPHGDSLSRKHEWGWSLTRVMTADRTGPCNLQTYVSHCWCQCSPAQGTAGMLLLARALLLRWEPGRDHHQVILSITVLAIVSEPSGCYQPNLTVDLKDIYCLLHILCQHWVPLLSALLTVSPVWKERAVSDTGEPGSSGKSCWGAGFVGSFHIEAAVIWFLTCEFLTGVCKQKQEQLSWLCYKLSLCETEQPQVSKSLQMFPVLSKVISATAATTREQAEHDAYNSSCANPPVLAPPLAPASPHCSAAARTQRLPQHLGHPQKATHTFSAQNVHQGNTIHLASPEQGLLTPGNSDGGGTSP